MSNNAKVKKTNKPSKWMVDDFVVKPGEDIHWEGPDSSSTFVVWFPSTNNPLEDSNEAFSKRGVAEARVKPLGGIIQKGARFPYCILLTDSANKEVVVGEKSPPEMIID